MDIFFLKNAVFLGLQRNIYFSLLILFCGYIYIYSYRFTVENHTQLQPKNRHGNRHQYKNSTLQHDEHNSVFTKNNAVRDCPPHSVFTKTTDTSAHSPVCVFCGRIVRFNRRIFTFEIITIARIQRYKINKNE